MTRNTNTLTGLVHDQYESDLSHIKSSSRVLDFAMQYRVKLDLDWDTIDTAIELFADATRTREHPGRGHAFVLAASIHLACQVHDVPRTLTSVSNIDLSDQDDTNPEVLDERLVRKEKLNVASDTGTMTTPIDSDAFLSRLATEHRVNEETLSAARGYLTEISDKRSGSPPAQAAGALWAAVCDTGEPVQQVDIADTLDLSAAAVRTNADLVDEPESETRAAS
jgi:transcription initiation factor TFIIIB Brf1 subunit/transcription initiation factor TFIIB